MQMDQQPPKKQTAGPIVHYVGMRTDAQSVVEVEFWSSRDDRAARLGYINPSIVIRQHNLLSGVVETREVPASSNFITEVVVAQIHDNQNNNQTEMLKIINNLSI
jgi:hypothetical protein